MKTEEIIEKWESRFNLQEGSQTSRIVYSRALLHEFLTDLRTLPESQSITPMSEEEIREYVKETYTREKSPGISFDDWAMNIDVMVLRFTDFQSHLLSKVTEEKPKDLTKIMVDFIKTFKDGNN
jgi:hypothetical protein